MAPPPIAAFSRIDHTMRTGVTGSPAFAGDDSLWLPQAHHVIAQHKDSES
jgi:hypothetical protein